MDTKTWSRRFALAQDEPRDAAAGLAASRVRNSLFGGDAPRMIGRYQPLRVIGKGGQGVVYEAEDPALDRRIALKLVEAGDPTEVRRVLREARMLARVPHPHIATIYDVGVVGTEVFLAMELVVGGNLQSWLSKPRSTSQILDVMLQCARALAFAHDAGVVHCDVKPHNVLVGNDGRVRVVDFGLARLQRSAVALDVDITAQIPIMASSYDSETDTGELSLPTGGGTPAYAAPEVWRNEIADAPADQFGFFVMLHEALLGRRPFGSMSGRKIAIDGDLELSFERGDFAPGWLRRMLRRGLAADPAARYPSMSAVCTALANPKSTGRRAVALFGAGAIGATVLAFGTGGGLDEDEPCHGIVAPVSDADQEALRAEIAERVAIFGDPTAPHANRRLEDHAAVLRDFRAAACGREKAVAQSQLACLDGLEREYDAALDLLAHSGAETRMQLAGVLDGLESPDTCLHRATDIEDPAVADLLAQTRVLLRAGRASDAYATSVLACAKLEDHGGAQWARCRGDMGAALMLAGRLVEAKALLEEGFDLAASLGHDTLAVSLAERLARITVELRLVGEARRWIGYLRSAALRDNLPIVDFNASISEAQLYALGDEYEKARELLEGIADAPAANAYSPSQHVAIEVRLASVIGRLGDSAEAYRHFDRGLALAEHLTPGDPMIGSLHSMRAQQLGVDGRYEEALAEYRVALALADVDLGPSSVTSTRARDGIADALMRLDRADEALVVADENVKIAKTRDDPLDLTSALHTRANVYLRLGRFEDARREAIETLTLSETEHGASAATRNARLTYANALESLGELDEARAVAKVAIEESVQLFGPDHAETMAAVIALAVTEAHAGNHAEALALHRRARAGFEASFGPDHPGVALESFNIAESLLSLGDPVAAVPEIERAHAFWAEAFGPDHIDTRDAAAMLARARDAAARASG